MRLHRLQATRPIPSRRHRRLSGLGATLTQAQYQQQAVIAEQDYLATGVSPVIEDISGTVTIVGQAAQTTGIMGQVTAAAPLSAANLTIATNLAVDAFAIQAM